MSCGLQSERQSCILPSHSLLLMGSFRFHRTPRLLPTALPVLKTTQVPRPTAMCRGRKTTQVLRETMMRPGRAAQQSNPRRTDRALVSTRYVLLLCSLCHVTVVEATEN